MCEWSENICEYCVVVMSSTNNVPAQEHVKDHDDVSGGHELIFTKN